jgi:hypothetical protein
MRLHGLKSEAKTDMSHWVGSAGLSARRERAEHLVQRGLGVRGASRALERRILRYEELPFGAA